MILKTQSNPSIIPCPVFAQIGCIYHLIFLLWFRPKCSVTSLTLYELGRSILFAKIRNGKSLNSSSLKNFPNSSFAS